MVETMVIFCPVCKKEREFRRVVEAHTEVHFPENPIIGPRSKGQVIHYIKATKHPTAYCPECKVVIHVGPETVEVKEEPTPLPIVENDEHGQKPIPLPIVRNELKKTNDGKAGHSYLAFAMRLHEEGRIEAFLARMKMIPFDGNYRRNIDALCEEFGMPEKMPEDKPARRFGPGGIEIYYR